MIKENLQIEKVNFFMINLLVNIININERLIYATILDYFLQQ